MREHIQTLIAALSDSLRATPRHQTAVEPRHRRPRRARATYVPVLRDLADAH